MNDFSFFLSLAVAVSGAFVSGVWFGLRRAGTRQPPHGKKPGQ